MHIIVLILSAILVTTSAFAQSFPLLDTNGDKATFVGTSPVLRGLVEACTGLQYDQISEAQYAVSPVARPIFVGQSQRAMTELAPEIAGLDAEGYIIKVMPSYVIIYAPPASTDTGDPLHFAEGDFARRFLGAGSYFAGTRLTQSGPVDLGLVTPNLVDVHVPVGTWVENPAILHRHFSGLMGRADNTWRYRASGGGGRFKFHHNMFRIVPSTLYTDHPDYFPVIKTDPSQTLSPVYGDLAVGERFDPATRIDYWQPNITHPDVLDLAVNAIIDNEVNGTGYDPGSFSLGINDSGGFCHCDDCLAVFPVGYDPTSPDSDGYRMYGFINQVATEVANAGYAPKLGFLVYGHLNDWAPGSLHPLLMPYITESFADCWDPAFKSSLYAKLQQWSGDSTQFGFYEYLFGSGFMIPRIYTSNLADGIRHLKSLGAEGFYAEAYANWGLEGPKLWIAEQLMWNPDQDEDLLLASWCDAVFAEASAPMQSYWAYLEETWMTQTPSAPSRGKYRLWSSAHKAEQFGEVFTAEKCDVAWALLEQAESVASQPIVQSRIAYFKDCFGATRLASQRYRAAIDMQALKDQETAAQTELPMLDWAVALEHWAKHPYLDAYMNDLRSTYEWAFYEFSQEKLSGLAPASFKVWDTEPDQLLPLANRLQLAALETAYSKAEYDLVIDDMISDLIAEGQAENRECAHGAELLKTIAKQTVVDGLPTWTPPVMDGTLESAWGAPQFAGAFWEYPFRAMPSPEQTEVYVRVYQNDLYIGFRCYQAPGTVDPGETGRDNVLLNANGYLSTSAVPAYLRGDSVGVILPGPRLVYVTAGGGIYDAQGEPAGVNSAWNGAEAYTQMLADGYSVEIKISLTESEADAYTREVQGGFNFVRITDNKRSAWVRANPNSWFVWPYATGTIDFARPRAIQGKHLTGDPIIDGVIDSVWGEGQVFGPFDDYPFLGVPGEHITKAWIGERGDFLYAAFYCYQDPASIIPGEAGHDVLTLKSNGVIASSPIPPYLINVDSVYLELPYVNSVAVTAGAGVMDAQSGPLGFDPAWDGVVDSAVALYPDGYAVEIRIAMTASQKTAWTTGRVMMNLARTRGMRRTAWHAAMPNYWSIFTRGKTPVTW